MDAEQYDFDKCIIDESHIHYWNKNDIDIPDGVMVLQIMKASCYNCQEKIKNDDSFLRYSKEDIYNKLKDMIKKKDEEHLPGL